MCEQSVAGKQTTPAAIVLLVSVLIAIAGVFVTPARAHADVDDFTVTSFHADYVLGRDAKGRSTLHTTEHIEILFPDIDQNRGFIRDLVRVYDDHPTDLKVISVTDETGAPREFTTAEYKDFLSVTIAVPKGQYVHGTQHYVIEYTQRDVTRFFDDTNADEFYWDTNGTGWKQPFGEVSATLTLTDGLESALNGDVSCYVGRLGSSTQCSPGLVQDGNRLSVEEFDLGRRENVTMAVGFKPGTFAAYPKPFYERTHIFLIGGFAGVVAAMGVFIVTLTRRRESRSGAEIVPRYDPPEMISIPEAAEMLGVPNKAMTATLLDFAVRGKLVLLYDSSNQRYGIKSLGQGHLLADERWIYARLLGDLKGKQIPRAGQTTWFSSSNTDLGETVKALAPRTKAGVEKHGLLKPAPNWAIWTVAGSMLVGASLLCLQCGLVIGTPLGIGTGLVLLLAALAGIVFAVCTLQAPGWPTELGSDLIDHLNGLCAYMQMADADRLRIAQSPSGSTDLESGVVDLYERLLPYAVLFGIEQQWQAVLEGYYAEAEQPGWFEWQGGQTYDYLPPIYDLDTRVQSAPVIHTTSSSGSGFGSGSGFDSSFSSFSGGSSGGGFSGGGGGGGGGRGI